MSRLGTKAGCAIVFAALGCGKGYSTGAVDECEPGWLDCNGSSADGCEIDSTSDRDHCGSCETPCGLGEVCEVGSCFETLCTDANEQAVVLRPAADTDLDNVDIVPTDDQAFSSLDDRGNSDGDDSYIAAEIAGQRWRARFSHEPLSLPEDRAISGIAIRTRARKADVGTGEVQVGIYVPSWDSAYGDPIYDSGFMTLTTSYEIYGREFDEQPWEDRPWTQAEIDELQVAVKGTPDPADGQVRATQLWLEICHLPK